MSDTILALLGFATVIAVIVLLLRNVTVPALAFVSVSTITAAILVATGAFTLDEMAGFIKEGVKGVHGTAVLFIFSVLFFGVMTDAGMFDKIIGALMKKVGNNVVGVALMTCLIASPEARATRRWKEYQQKGVEVSYEEVLADVRQRDYQDTHRAAAPLRQADDAQLLDTSEMNFEQSLEAMKKMIVEKVG